ncbi:uncharacterized protein Gasu_64230 [Galdieria sulphuraria]|uniref:Uncharacterized protein n=1 Tax=Galdieria sulphuraria TaxID=130081 RepID=M2XR71_GALSU|nr:uncharacterized protein Gasu_64230 [Galdieria sulphuraria]EME25919.1 hypothetical protein Gasu_64230 [Galdieria sulphuraria]|eukprot:XP_005702439.1 hypothetical protein Gasu_64230 [Galdieria sulphuraria]
MKFRNLNLSLNIFQALNCFYCNSPTFSFETLSSTWLVFLDCPILNTSVTFIYSIQEISLFKLWQWIPNNSRIFFVHICSQNLGPLGSC